MAILKDGKLKVEFKFIDHFEGNYSLEFFYDSRPLINPEIMGEGFLGYDEGETLTPILEKTLSNGRPNVWRPECPAAIIEIRFSHKYGWTNEKAIEFHIATSRCRSPKIEEELYSQLGAKLPNDYFELTFLGDVWGLKIPYPRDTNFIGDYIAVRISVTREALENFTNTLKKEYKEYLVKKE